MAAMKIVEEIEELISRINTDYPELYKYFDELPTPNLTDKDISENDLKIYLQDLQQRLAQYQKTHKLE